MSYRTDLDNKAERERQMTHQNEVYDTFCKDMSLTDDELLKEMAILKTYKANAVVLESNCVSFKREYYALCAAEQALREKIEREKFKDENYDKAIESLTAILDEATQDENSVCYVTDCDADALTAGIKALQVLKEMQCREKERRQYERE